MDIINKIEKVNPEFAEVLREEGKVDVLTTTLDLTCMELESLRGVEYFENLESLHVSYSQLTSLDVSKNLKLESLSCHGNKLTSLDLSKNVKLDSLWCYDNELISLDVSNNLNIEILMCGNNPFTDLDLSNNPKLTPKNICQNVFANEGVKIKWHKSIQSKLQNS